MGSRPARPQRPASPAQPVAAQVDSLSKASVAASHSSDLPAAVPADASRESEGSNDLMLAEVYELREQLDGKNELIAALVAELEQVVEQLDRVKRSGSDRGRAAGSAAVPSEMLEEQQQVLGELQRVVQQWDEMQTALALGRIESEIAELRSLVSEGVRVRPHTDAEATDLDSVLARLTPPDSEPAAMSSWEALKRQMVGEAESTPEDTVPPVEEPVTECLTTLLAGVETPSPVDLDSAGPEDLRQALADRDVYIVQLTRWIRTRRAVTVPENWDELGDVPGDLVQKVEHLAGRLEEQVRLAEVEMSLERARLSREKSQLQADRAVMDKHMKRLGISSLDELEDIAVSSNSAGDRRWMRFLGVNRRS